MVAQHFSGLLIVRLEDIHRNDRTRTKKHRVGSADFEEIMYADDTICITENAEAMARLLRAIETESSKYGLKLNYDKCELIQIYRGGNLTEQDNVYFANHTAVRCKNEAKYLGCWLNDRGDPEREIKQRISNCMAILKKLDIYWRKANPSCSQKLLVYDAIIRSKLLYGLESAAMNQTTKHKLDTFQLKGLRKILGVNTTCIDRSKDNKTVMDMAQKKVNDETKKHKTPKQLKPFSQVYEERNNLTCSNR